MHFIALIQGRNDDDHNWPVFSRSVSDQVETIFLDW
jgi:hypothetical protein